MEVTFERLRVRTHPEDIGNELSSHTLIAVQIVLTVRIAINGVSFGLAKHKSYFKDEKNIV